MQINLELYRVFYIAARSGSLTKAAQELFISQPAVSQSIKQLETQIGGKLFIRTNKGMKLTYEGKIIYEYIKQANILIDMAEKKFSQLKQLTFGEINIGASDTITKFYLSKYIKKFNTKFPDVNIKISNRTSMETISLLRSGKVDLGFVNLPIDDKYVDCKECLTIHDVFICSKAYAKNIDHPLSPQELTQFPLLLLEKAANSRKVFDEAMLDHSVVFTPKMELGSLDLILEFVKMGMGIGLATAEFLDNEIDSGELCIVPTTFKLPTRAIGMVHIKGIPLNFAAGQFVNMISSINATK